MALTSEQRAGVLAVLDPPRPLAETRAALGALRVDPADPALADLLSERGFTADARVSLVERDYPALVALPPGYTDTPAERSRLIAHLWRAGMPGVQVERIYLDATGVLTAVVTPHSDPRPAVQTWQLDAGIRPTAGPQVAAHADRQHLTMVDWDPYAHTATVAAVAPAVRQLRDRIAAHLHCDPWAVEIQPRWTVDAETGEGRLDSVEVLRHPAFQTAEKRISAFTEAISILPGGSSGWKVEDDPQSGRVTLRHGAPIVVPQRVPLEVMPQVLDPARQWQLPIGLDGRGDPVAWDLRDTPHLGVVGGTGSGKTISLWAVISAALVRGFELAIVETSKTGQDFEALRPYVRNGFWGCDSKMHACQVIESVYALREGRLPAIRSARDGDDKPRSMADLSRAEQERIGVRPLLLVVDEASALFTEPVIPRALDKDHPRRVAAEEEATAVALAGDSVRRIAAELRAAGIHLVFATQRFTAELLKAAGGNSLKVNLGARLALGTMSKLDAGLAFQNPERGEAAYALAHGVSPTDGDEGLQKRPGRAVFETPTRTRPMQTVFAPEMEWIRRLEAAGVPRPGGASPTLDGDGAIASPSGDGVTIQRDLDLGDWDLDDPETDSGEDWG